MTEKSNAAPKPPRLTAVQELLGPGGPPHALVANMGVGLMLMSRAIYTAAEFGIADALANGPRQVGDLAKELDVNEDILFRLMRILEAMEIFERTDDGGYRNTPHGDTLRSDVPASMRAWCRYFGSSFVWDSFRDSPGVLKTGRPVYENRGEPSFYEQLVKDQPLHQLFDGSMSSSSQLSNIAYINSYDFSGLKTLTDMGGGTGALMREVLRKFPEIRGTLFDMPPVIQRARSTGLVAEFEKAGRCELVPGSFFESVPSGMDAYLFTRVLHNWDDSAVEKVFHVVRKAAGGAGRKLLLFETLVDNSPRATMTAKLGDFIMLAQLGGRARTLDEFHALFLKTGFKLNRVVPTGSPYSVVEGISV